MKRPQSEYERTLEVAKRLFNPGWVKRYHGGDEVVAARALAEKYGFSGRTNYMQHLCELLLDYPDREDFEEAVRDHHQTGLRLMAQRLAHCEIVDDPTLAMYTAPCSDVLVGDCYRQAFHFVVDVAPEGSFLVHGHIREGGPSAEHVAHAWVELPGDIIYDGVLQRFYRRKGYYRKRDARRTFAVAKADAALALAVHFHYGPWGE
jgi:hypothetical protein